MKESTERMGKKRGHILKIYNPTAYYEFKPFRNAPRLASLKNKTIGLHWNNKARGDVALKRVRELLCERFEGLKFEWFYSRVNMGVPEEWFEEVRKSGVDAIVGSTGD